MSQLPRIVDSHNSVGRRPSGGLLETAITDVWPTQRWVDTVVVVAVSGGADSTALLTSLHRLARENSQSRGQLIVAHYNHHARGDDSNRDEAFVRALATQFGLPFVAGHQVDTARDEATMAKHRRQFLSTVAAQRGARYIALGQHADDNVETMLHHLMRGTGPAGLCGMPMFRCRPDEDVVWVRPMLNLRREQILHDLVAHSGSYCHDDSNDDLKYTRNWIRGDLLPRLRQRFATVDDNLSGLIETMQSWRSTLDRLADQWTEQHVGVNADGICISVDTGADPAVVIHSLQAVWDRAGFSRKTMNREHWQRLATEVASPTCTTISMPGGVVLRSTSNWVHILTPET